MGRQDQFEIPNSEELSQMKEENSKLEEELTEQKKGVAEMEGEEVRLLSHVMAEIKALQSNLTFEEIQARHIKLGAEVNQMEEKLIKLREVLLW